MPIKRIGVSILFVAVLVSGLVAGVVLLRERQDLRKLASTPDGEATVTLSPESGTYQVGDTFTVSVFFNTSNLPISGVATLLTYPYAGSSANVSVSNVQVNPTIMSSGEWTCPTVNSSESSGLVQIEIACANISATGFSSNTNVLFATFDVNVDAVPTNNPVVVEFDPGESIITKKVTGQDVLLVPTSKGTFTIGQIAVATVTPAPTGVVQITLTPTLTPTPTTILALTPTSTQAVLPDAGVALPTTFGILLGIGAIVGSLLLVL